MDREERGASSSVSSNAILWLALIAGGAFLVHEAPWKVSRPTEPAVAVYRNNAVQDIDARLWQDPLGAVARGREEEQRRAASDPGLQATTQQMHAIGALHRVLCEDTGQASGDTLLLGAMVSGGPYPEYAESRRRARYAVLAALHEAGYTPDDAEHVGYVLPQSLGDRVRLPQFVAYEWLSPRPPVLRNGANGDATPTHGKTTTTGKPAGRVLLLWLDNGIFWPRTAANLDGLLKQLHGPGCPRHQPGAPDLIVLGPGDSALLRDLLKDPYVPSSNLVFYDYAATADDARILPSNYAKQKDDKFFGSKQIVVFRTIGTDQDLAQALVHELELRGAAIARSTSAPQRGRHMVLISERDTLYGRTLPTLVADAVNGCSKGMPPCPTSDHPYGPRVHAFSYLRGLDGQLPSYSSTVATASSDSGSARDERKTEVARVGDDKRIERPEGQSQLDYLRRLVDQLAATERQLRHDHGATIGAIGVLGSDVYDKLLILQALRPRFPNAIFFTTELDARLLHPQELQWTRNLIVASSFGLTLHRALQGESPPFRDAYQTSLFFATRIALENATRECGRHATNNDLDCFPITQVSLDAWLARPRIYEIGRNVAFDLSEGPGAEGTPVSRELPDCILPASCPYVHAEPSPMFPAARNWAMWTAYAALIVGAFLLAMVTGRLQRAIAWARGEQPHPWRAMRLVPLVTLAILVVALGIELPDIWNWLGSRLTADREGTPVTLFEGVSIWPSELIRLIAFGLAIWFIRRGWSALDDDGKRIAKTMLWQPEREILIKRVHDTYSHCLWWQNVMRMFSFRLVERQPGAVDPATGLTPNAEQFWSRYVYQGRPAAIAVRVAAVTLLYLALGFAVSIWFGFPDAPYRGAVAEIANRWITLAAVIAMLTLIFFVVDATAFCTQLIIGLRSDLPPSTRETLFVPGSDTTELRWPLRTLNHYSAKLQVDARYVDQWIAMHFVARRTRVVGRLVYYPFIVLSLMVLARSSVFDNWTMPAALIVVMGTSVVIVIACAAILRWASEALRRKAIWRLTNEIIGLKGSEPKFRKTAEQLQTMIEQIRSFRSGAFAPYAQQPVIRALLLPLSSYGGAALLEYLTIWTL